MPHRASISGRRFSQLAKELNDAIAIGDLARESKLRSELESIVVAIRDQSEVAKARSRERRRIVAAINRSLEQIRKHDPSLARALGGALKTREFFSYSPASTGLGSTGLIPSQTPSKKLPPRR